MPQSKKINFYTFFALLFLLFFIISADVEAAGLVPCGTGLNDPCTLCHFIVGIKGLIDWGMGILITLSITAITIAGVMYVVSSGDTELTKKAKNFVTSAIIGFSLMLGAWLIINVTLWVFAAKGDLGIGKTNWYTFTCSTTSTATGTAVTVESPMTEFDCEKFSFQTSNIKAQCTKGDASPDLKKLMICMKSKLGSAMTINSISDNAGLAFCSTTYDKDRCAHSKSSCHYGGASGGKSQAIDISTKNLDINTITTAANACGAGFINPEPETNHVHVSTTACRNN